jgi:hypothetical protein
MRSFTDIFIKHPVLAVVVNLVIVLVGWRAVAGLPVQQYPQVESSSVVITTAAPRRWPRSPRASSRSVPSCRPRPSRRSSRCSAPTDRTRRST